MIRSIFGRLLLSHIGVILLTIVSFGALMSYLIRDHVIETKRLELLGKSQAIAGVVTRAADRGTLNARLEVLGDLIAARIWVVDQRGRVLAGNPPPRWGSRPFPENSPRLEALFGGETQSWIRSREPSDPSIIVAAPVILAGAPAAVFLYTPITGINQAIQAIDRLVIFSLVFGMMATTILGFFIARGLTNPLANISKAAARFAGGDYAARTDATGRDEVGKLGQTFNAMADSLAMIEQNRRDFLANVSHELKTPVASIQALAEAIHDGVAGPQDERRYLATIISETNRIDHILHDLQDLSLLEAGELAVLPERIELAAYLTREAEKYNQLLAAKNLSIRLDLPAALPPVLADGSRLAQILTNLIANAVRYSPDGGVITIGARPAAGKVAIAVSDAGPGIPPADQPYIFDRFYRVDKSRSRSGGGTGLGLAITRNLVRAMGGEITVNSPPGAGATFTFTLPVA
jgi:signal transduction histidine kinase